MTTVLSETHMVKPKVFKKPLIDKKILVVEDDYALREALEDTLSLVHYSVITAKNAEQAIAILAQEKAIHMVVSDINMGELSGHDLLKHVVSYFPHIPVLLMTAYGSVRDSVDAIRNGAVDYLVKPFEPKELVDIVGRQLGYAVTNNDELPIAEDEYSRQLLQLSARVAQSNSTVLIIGESGTGKEVLARYIHQQSSRSKEPFIAINCAAIPENMLEAMLFGYEKGAYTGAYNSTPGKFEQANGGTLLLDEISEMDINLQAKLLRVLQEREVERLGGRKTIPLDVRVIATSNRDMAKHVAEGKFREDLYYRLSVLPLVWKPLRERVNDILPLALLLLSKHSAKQRRKGLVLSESAQRALLQYSWPGNVRELDNVIQRAMILQPGNIIVEDDLGLGALPLCASTAASSSLAFAPVSESLIHSHSDIAAKNTPNTFSIDEQPMMEESLQPLGDNLQKREFEIIEKTLREENGSRQNTAKRLGISPRTLRYKLAKMRAMEE
jgi:two-component system, response regulator FlrC